MFEVVNFDLFSVGMWADVFEISSSRIFTILSVLSPG